MNLIDYSNCIVNVSNSILNYYGIKTFNKTLSELDQILFKTKPKNIILFLCDGLGMETLKSTLPIDSFLIRNLKAEITSVFPTTTVAATTSIMTGLYPNQHCWLGWDNYISKMDKVVTMFLNKEKETGINLPSELSCEKIFPYTTIMNIISKEKNISTKFFSPYSGERYNGLSDLCNKLENECNSNNQNFIYAYYENPDSIMHQTGLESNETIENINFINEQLELLSKKLEDTMLIVTADHGLIESNYLYLEDYKELFECLKHTTSIDSRAPMFFVKDEKKKIFENLFDKYFKNDFILYNKTEILNKKLFGINNNHNLFESCIGDYIAVSIGNRAIKYKRKGSEHIASHSGLTIDECKVPLILCFIDKEEVLIK
ncbi:MAG: alkaline phosphatase family protein [Bacilli bacterium]|nr:alkaline phosphatase family protein [Bacilli bacterium]